MVVSSFHHCRTTNEKSLDSWFKMCLRPRSPSQTSTDQVALIQREGVAPVLLLKSEQICSPAPPGTDSNVSSDRPIYYYNTRENKCAFSVTQGLSQVYIFPVLMVKS